MAPHASLIVLYEEWMKSKEDSAVFGDSPHSARHTSSA